VNVPSVHPNSWVLSVFVHNSKQGPLFAQTFMKTFLRSDLSGFMLLGRSVLFIIILSFGWFEYKLCLL
jgi:hypothetical protein